MRTLRSTRGAALARFGAIAARRDASPPARRRWSSGVSGSDKTLSRIASGFVYKTQKPDGCAGLFGTGTRRKPGAPASAALRRGGDAALRSAASPCTVESGKRRSVSESSRTLSVSAAERGTINPGELCIGSPRAGSC